MDYDRIDVRYLPKANVSKYLYTGALDAKARQGKPLKSILSRKDDIAAYSQKLEDAIHQVMNITHFSLINDRNLVYNEPVSQKSEFY